MLDKFSKLKEISNINKEFIDADSVEQQLKSMKLGYIQLAFVFRGMQKDYQDFHDRNFKKFDEETINLAEGHAVKQLDNPDYYTGEVMKRLSNKVKECVQSLLMIRQKKEELDIKESEIEVVKRNITWLTEIFSELVDKDIDPNNNV